MQPDYIDVAGERVAVYQSSGNGLNVVLIHCNSGDSLLFENQLTGFLGETHKIYALDLPGCGCSSWSKSPEKRYNLQGFADVIANAVEKLQIARPVLLGHSSGGHIAMRAAQKISAPAGCVLLGTPPLASAEEMQKGFLPSPVMEFVFKTDLNEEEVNTWATQAVVNQEVSGVIADKIRATDPNFRGYTGQSIQNDPFDNELALLSRLQVPIAILHGEHDRLISYDYLKTVKHPKLWNDEVQVIKDTGHYPFLEDPEQFNRLLLEFLKIC